MTIESLITLLVSGIVGGGLLTGIVALRKDIRDKHDGVLSLTQQAQEIAEKAVLTVRGELATLKATTDDRILALEDRVQHLETLLKAKDKIITLLVRYVSELRRILDEVKPQHPLPEVPDELKDLLSERRKNGRKR